MEKIKTFLKDFTKLVNKIELNDEDIINIRNYICYFSEEKEKNSFPKEYQNLTNYLLYNASIRIRTFGYNRLNKFELEDFDDNCSLSTIKDECIKNYYMTQTGYTLDKAQKFVIDEFERNRHRLFLSAPTSFGKTFLLQEIIYRNYNSYNNIVIVLPTVALLMEVSNDLSKYFKINKLSYKIFNSIYKNLELADKNVFILTPERTLRLLSLYPDLNINFFFYDEIYKIDEDLVVDEDKKDINDKESNDNRAVAFRLALYYLLQKTKECYIAGPFIDINSLKDGFEKLLVKYDIKKLQINFEPTFKKRYNFTTTKLKVKTPFEDNVVYTKKKTSKEKLKYVINFLNINNNNQAIVYCLYPRYSERYANEYCNTINDITEDNDIKMFIEHLKRNYSFIYSNGQNSFDKWGLINALNHSVGIHNGRFPKYFQREIINLYNDKKLPILFCTSTIVEGVNTNAKTVILYNNPQGENKTGQRFLLLNINGRAGRYSRHFIGNIVYLAKDCIVIENESDISLDFKLFSDEINLEKIDLENTLLEDLSENNKNLKNNIKLDKDLLPDNVFELNRLIERQKQEKILKILCREKVFNSLKGIQKATIDIFIEYYFEIILNIWAEIGEINIKQVKAIKYFTNNYARNGFNGLFEYRVKNRQPKDNDKNDEEYVNYVYDEIFTKVKDTIEYQIPKILSLFEALIARMFFIKGYTLDKELDFSNIIRYFEVGSKTELGTDMIEKGVPNITIKKIERGGIDGDTLLEQQETLKKMNLNNKLDAYEMKLIKKYITEQCN